MWSVISALIWAFFSSIWKRLFPAKSADAQRAEDLQATVDVLKAEAKSAQDAPTNETAMEALLKEHKL